MTGDVNDILSRLAALEQRANGLFCGLVEDDKDPMRRGRLRLLVPALLGDQVSGWAEACVPYIEGQNVGTCVTPPMTRDRDGNPTTRVWVTFRGGDVRFPVWLGTMCGAGDATETG